MTKFLKTASFFLLACLSLVSTTTAEALYAEKAVVIDADWRISTEYRYIISIDSDDERLTFSEIFLPESDPVRSILYPFGHYGGADGPESPARVAGNRLLLDGLRKGDRVTYGFTIASTCFGFEGTFTDLFNIQRHGKTRHARYTVTFPEPVAFQWMVDSENGGDAQRQVREAPAGQFVWDSLEAGAVPDKALLRVTTFMTWGQVAQHFMALYERIHGRETDAFPVPRLSVSDSASEDEKIAAAVLLLDKEFEYRTYLSVTHNLLPDAPRTVFIRRWGDCKDLTLLGASLLRSAGVDAFPVLLGPENGSKKALSFPDPFLLQHAVLGLRVGNATRYYDWTVPGGEVDFSGKQLVSLGKEPS